MVGRLVQAVQDAYAPARLGGRGEYGQGKRLLVHHLRAAEGEHEATGRHLGKGGGIQALIGPEGVFEGAAVLGEGRRVHNHKVVGAVRDVFYEFNRVRAVGAVPVGPETVQGHVALHHVHGPPGTVHGVHVEGAAGKGVNGETAGIAEEVQDLAACGQGAHAGPVLPLVQEEAGLLALAPVYDEAVPVFQDTEFIGPETGSLVQIAVHQVQAGLEGGGAGTFVVNGLQALSVEFLQGLGNGGLGAEHAHGMGLEHAYAVIIVYDETGKAVALPMHQPVASGNGRCGQGAGFAQLVGAGEHAEPVVGPGGVFVKTEHPHGDGANLVVAAAQEPTVGRTDAYEVAFCRMAHNLGHGAGKHPGMIAEEGFFPPVFQDNFIHSAAVGGSWGIFEA